MLSTKPFFLPFLLELELVKYKLILISNNSILGDGGFLGSTQIYVLRDPETNQRWSRMTQSLAIPRSFHTAFLVPDHITTCTTSKIVRNKIRDSNELFFYNNI